MEAVNISFWIALIVNVIILILLFRELHKLRHKRRNQNITPNEVIKQANAWRDCNQDNRTVIVYFSENNDGEYSIRQITSGFSNNIIYTIVSHMIEDEHIADIYQDAVNTFNKYKAKHKEDTEDD